MKWSKETENDWKFIQKRLVESELDKELEKYSKDLDKALENGKGRFSEDFIRYEFTRRKIGKIIKEDFMLMCCWLTKKERIFPIFYDIWEFIQTGSLKDKYKNNGGFYKYAEDAEIQLIEVPRSLGKTTIFLGCFAVWKFINFPEKKWLILHGDKKKAEQNLGVIRNLILSKNLSVIYPELFAETKEDYKAKGSVIRKDMIDISFDFSMNNDASEFYEVKEGINVRKEATFTLGSPGIDRTGMHFDGVIADDLVVKGTSKTHEATENLIDYFENLFGLAEVYEDFPVYLTGTEWYDQSLYHYLRKKNSSSVFVCPAYWDTDDGREFIAPSFNDTIIERIKDKMKKNFAPQFLMQPLPLENEVEFAVSDDFIFCFADEDVQGVEKIQYTKEQLKRNGCTVTSFDPSYQTNNKSWNDDGSKASISSGTVCEETLYLYDSWQALGGELHVLYDAFLEQIQNNESDCAIADAQGTQIANSKDWLRKLKVDYGDIRYYHHTKGSIKGTTGKAQRAMLVLGEAFNSGIIKVHYSQKRIIDEIMRISRGFDFIDTIVQIRVHIHDFRLFSNIYKNKKANMLKDNVREMQARKRKKKKVYFKASGY